MSQKYSPKLLAPAGSFENLYTALNAGADEIYFGGKELNMRSASSKNFEIKDFKKVAKLCHQKGVKCYLTLNTVLFDEDLKQSYKLIDAVKKSGIDGVIVSDVASILYAYQKGVEVHVSVQSSITNIESVKFYSQWADRVVLARELDLKMQKQICTQIKKQKITGPSGNLVEVEVFAHGALCVAISGKCGMSLLTYNKSANRGECLQPCRRKYKIEDTETGRELAVENEYVMSSSDLCTIGFLDEILDTGITVLKIEGRNKPAEYVDTVIKTYREALDAVKENTYTEEKIKQWNQDLGTVYNRGLGSGYYLGKTFKDWSGLYGSRATKKKTYLGDITHFYPKIKVAEILLRADGLKIGEEYIIVGADSGLVRGKIEELRSDDQREIEKAKKGEIISIKISSKVKKGDKIYKFVDR